MKNVVVDNWILNIDSEHPFDCGVLRTRVDDAYTAFSAACEDLTDEERAFFEKMDINLNNGIIDYYYDCGESHISYDVYYVIPGKYIDVPPFDSTKYNGEFAEQQYMFANEINVGRISAIFCVPGRCSLEFPFEQPENTIVIHVHFDSLMCETRPSSVPAELCEEHHEKCDEYSCEFEAYLSEIGVQFEVLAADEVEYFKDKWLVAFSDTVNIEKGKMHLCNDDIGRAEPLWHLFSYEYAIASEGEKAREEYDLTIKEECVILLNWCTGYRVKDAKMLTAARMDGYSCYDLLICDSHWHWTYATTHEQPHIGPFFKLAE